MMPVNVNSARNPSSDGFCTPGCLIYCESNSLEFPNASAILSKRKLNRNVVRLYAILYQLWSSALAPQPSAVSFIFQSNSIAQRACPIIYNYEISAIRLDGGLPLIGSLGQ